MAAALAYYTIFSLAPLLILLFSLAGLIFEDDAARETLFEQVEAAAGSGIADTVADLVAARSGGGGSGTFATVLGFLFLFVGASGLFLQLRASLNTVWDIPQEETSGMLNIVRARVSGFAAVLVLASALLIFTVGSGLVAFFAEEIEDAVPAFSVVIQILNPIVAILGVGAVIAILFRLLPAGELSWRIALRGGVVTTLLMAIGAVLVGVLFSFSNPGDSFGQFAAIIVLLVFIYYLAQSFFLGAEVTAAMDRRLRSRPGDDPLTRPRP